MIDVYEARKIMEGSSSHYIKLDKCLNKIEKGIREAASRCLGSVTINVGGDRQTAEDLKILVEGKYFRAEILDSGVDGLYLRINW
jgi:hypothetical protein